MKLLRSIDTKKAASLAGTILMLVSLVFVAERILSMRHDLDLAIFTSPRTLVALFAIACVEAVAVILLSLNFRGLVTDVSGVPVDRRLAVKVYAVSNLYKYIPGGVMYVLGRNQMAVQTDELGHGKVALATVLEGVTLVAAASILSTVYAFHYSFYYFRQIQLPPMAGLILVFMILLSAPVLYLCRRRLKTALEKLKDSTKDFRLRMLFKRLGTMLLLINLSPLTFLVTLMILGQPLYLELGVTVMGLFILSWLAGFLTPGAPSGLGIREAVLLMFLSATVNEGILLSAIVTHRILAVTGDVIAYGIALAYAKWPKKPLTR